MKRRDLIRHLVDCGCEFIREGGNHSWWYEVVVMLPDSAHPSDGMEVHFDDKRGSIALTFRPTGIKTLAEAS